jgi:hypothetical protein
MAAILGTPTRSIEDLCRDAADDYPGALFIELGPGAVVSSAIKRIAPGTEAVACGTATQVHELLNRIAT